MALLSIMLETSQVPSRCIKILFCFLDNIKAVHLMIFIHFLRGFKKINCWSFCGSASHHAAWLQPSFQIKTLTEMCGKDSMHPRQHNLGKPGADPGFWSGEWQQSFDPRAQNLLNKIGVFPARVLAPPPGSAGGNYQNCMVNFTTIHLASKCSISDTFQTGSISFYFRNS